MAFRRMAGVLLAVVATFAMCPVGGAATSSAENVDEGTERASASVNTRREILPLRQCYDAPDWNYSSSYTVTWGHGYPQGHSSACSYVHGAIRDVYTHDLKCARVIVDWVARPGEGVDERDYSAWSCDNNRVVIHETVSSSTPFTYWVRVWIETGS